MTVPSRYVEFLRRRQQPAAAVEPPPHQPGKGEAWCSKCEAWTDRADLPAIPASKLYGEIPAFFFCTYCGVVDFGYEPGDAA